jgi:hypothetical protein
VVGEKGLAVIGGIALNKIEAWRFIEKLSGDDGVAREYSQDVPTGYGLSHGPLIQKIIDHIKDGDLTPPISVDEVIPTLQLVHALYRSAEKQQPVAVGKGALSTCLGR